MRVLKHPEPPKPVNYSCKDCSALLEVEKGDCKLVSDQREGSYYTFNCPVCKRMQSMAAKIPRNW